ncbi:MAG TPA: four helix bundle protein [Ignavibacteria bacterium]|nr:four helix bundle protein [Ignavibacteria bacterium]HMR40780.1 four helix bundle protein [Ignavibacteria bacterium]
MIWKIVKFIHRIIKPVENLPSNMAGYYIADQIMRTSTSVGADFRAACRSVSEQ